MVALARGDRSAFEPVFATLWPLLRRFCGRALRDPQLAEDAAQGSLMKLFLNASEFREDGDVLAWALGIAAFECRTLRNRGLRRGESLGEAALLTVPGTQLSPEDATIAADLRAAVLDVMHTLHARDLEAIERVLDPAPAPPAGPALRKRLQRALQRLRIAWRHTHGHDD
jgi:RNA polymerase sigma-70 factor (ECF subfamily)